MSGSRSVSEKFIAPHIAALPRSGIRKFFDLVNTMDGVISLGVGEPDFTTPWHIRECGVYSLESGHTAYTSNLGMPGLRRVICDYLRANYRVDYDFETECLVSVGVSEALDLTFRALISPGDEVIYAAPAYVSYPACIAMAHGVPVPLATRVENGFAVDPAELEKLITPRTRALLLNFPCNPTGAVMNKEQLQRIADIAVQHDLIIVSDEIYSELCYDEEYHSIAALPGMKERTVFLHGLSKAFAMTGWRIGYACAPAPLIGAMMKIHQYTIMCAPTMAQEAAIEALSSGRKSMLEMRQSYLERRNMLVTSLNEAGLPCLMPHGTFYAFPQIAHTGLTSEEFASELLKREKVAVVPGNAFGECGEGFIRCCYASSVSDLREAARRIKHFMQQL